MIGGGIAGILALQAAGAFDSYKKEEPSYTVRHAYTCSSPTASVNTCDTACQMASDSYKREQESQEEARRVANDWYYAQRRRKGCETADVYHCGTAMPY